ncbi:EscU/YscU/HrcU family type III secretion system export apparatus switch protein [Fredinandcohnia onubensis]|uniref:EscU/YscU/HrcU family type III secretion system export apparatus switch protein n=1 Tax=Fredinandcohnia onubensis TaxID=1571209 RepID=UPI000C0BEA75|nr:EscU/YscU/HrcU family type III secretion system export apparatus switch protein [Fredinandcohnia onubensis]
MKKLQKNKTKMAVALSYNEKIDSEPKVIAKGRGLVAKKIIDKAKEHEVPIQEDTVLVELLGELRLNEGITEDLYQVIAEIFAFVYQIDKNLEESKK